VRWRRAVLVFGATSLAVSPVWAQPCAGVRRDRVAVIGGTYVGAWALAAAFHPREWWQGHPGAFLVNWSAGPSPAVGQDYLLHVAATYQASQAAALAWEWACVPRGTAVWLGAATAFAVGLPKKVVDGFHETGFEVAKNLANGVGALLPVVHATWPATRAVSLKGFYFPSAEFRNRGTGEPTTPLADYTGQRYFLSVNPARGGLDVAWWPKWLGVAVGHAATPRFTDPPARHVWYATLDLEFRGLPVRAAWWRPVAAVLDQIHVPAPGVRLMDGRVSVGVF
jgi:hypothetical protein